MPWKQADPVWEPEEYPKMLTTTDKDGHIVPVYYPVGHEKQGHAVIFENAEDERGWNVRAPRRGK